MVNNLKKISLSGMVIFLLFIMAFYQILILNYDLPKNKAKAESTWVQNTDDDFYDGFLMNLSVEDQGTDAILTLDTGSIWINKSLTSSPSARYSHAMAPIFGTNEILLFGGENSKKSFNDTWIYNLTQNKWFEITPKSSPKPNRFQKEMAPIHGTDNILLFSQINNDTWVFDLSNNTWTKKSPKNAPSPRGGYAMATIYNTNKVMIFGGKKYEYHLNDTWIYDLSNNNWTRMYPEDSPDERSGQEMASIYGTDKVILYGGGAESIRGDSGGYYNEYWIYDLSENNWSYYFLDARPNFDGGYAMAHVYGTDKVVFFSNETWIYDLSDNNWTKTTPKNNPGPRYKFEMASIFGTEKVLLFGGDDGGQSNDTWVFNLFSNIDNGFFISEAKDTGTNSSFKMLYWDAETTAGTSIEFQIRTAFVKSELTNNKFVGPNGSPGTYYITPGQIWSGHERDRWVQFIVYMSTDDKNYNPILKSVSITYNCYPQLALQHIYPLVGNINDQFNFTVNYFDFDNDTPEYIKVCIDGINHTMIESNNLDNTFYDGKGFWFTTSLTAGNHTYQFFASDGEVNCSTNISNLKVSFGPLAQIIVEPSLTTITTDDYQLFTAKGFDADDNHIDITPTWEVTGGGTIDQFGNFTATSSGIWVVYANVSGISGNSTINIISGKLNQIIITPQHPTITCDDHQLFIAIGYDKDLNPLAISPHWVVSGGGIINQTGNFSAEIPGIWVLYASVGNIIGNATIEVIDYKEENGSDNYTNDSNITYGDGNNTNKIKKDSDRDGMPDEWEEEFGFNLSDPSDAELDYDSDNLTNLEEYLNHTDPTNPDTDNDSYNDGLEVDKGTDPLDDEDYPIEKDKEKIPHKKDYTIFIILGTIIILILIFLSVFKKKPKEEPNLLPQKHQSLQQPPPATSQSTNQQTEQTSEQQ